jgi:hypothetical protein
MDHNDFKLTFCDVMPIIYKAAPILAGFIGSPLTALILGLLGALTGCNPGDHGLLAEKLKNDPDLFTKLQSLDLTHGEWFKSL